MLSQDSWPNVIGDSREEETFCVDTKHLRGGEKAEQQNLGIYYGSFKCHVLNMLHKNSDARLYANVVLQTEEA